MLEKKLIQKPVSKPSREEIVAEVSQRGGDLHNIPGRYIMPVGAGMVLTWLIYSNADKVSQLVAYLTK